MSLHMHDLDFADTLIGTNMFLVRQGGSVGEDRQVSLTNIKNFMLTNSELIEITSPSIEMNGETNIVGSLLINGVPIIEAVGSDHNHDTLYFRQDYLSAALANKSDITHNHGLLYYTKSETYNKIEMDDKVEDIALILAENIPTHDHDDLYYTESEIDNRFDNFNFDVIAEINNDVAINGDFIVSGNFTVSGTTTTVNTETVEIKDNIIEINSNQTGVPIGLTSGLEINRGDEDNYQLVFTEESETFKVGIVGDLQPIATREDNPIDDGIARWNQSANKFYTQTASDLKAEIVNPITSTLLNDINDLETLINSLQTQINNLPTTIFNTIMPIGFTYTQYQGQLSPDQMGWSGTWTNVSDTKYGGMFFRAEGSTYDTQTIGGTIKHEAKTFGNYTSYQSDAMRKITGELRVRGTTNVSAPAVAPDNEGAFKVDDNIGTWDNSIYTASSSSYYSHIYFDSSDVVPTDDENRPINQTIRIWERTA